MLKVLFSVVFNLEGYFQCGIAAFPWTSEAAYRNYLWMSDEAGALLPVICYHPGEEDGRRVNGTSDPVVRVND